MTYSIPERIFIVEAYVQTSSIKETQQLFRDKYPLRSVPAKSSIQDLVRKWRTTGSIKNVTRNRTPSVRTPQLTARINEFMTRSPRKSTTRLAQQVHVSRRTCGRVLKCLKFKPYRVTAVQQLKEPDRDKRVNFCRWLLDMVADGHLDPLMFIMSDEAWFHLSGYVNSQNSRYWATQNPNLLFEQPLHDQKIGVWCAMTAKRIVGPIFFDTTVNTDVYLTFLEELYSQLTEEENNYCFFQQDGATCHTSERSLARIHQMFTEERTVSKNLWPPRSPDLSTCDFYLWGYLKGKVYEQNPHTIDDLKDNIRNCIRSITHEELTRVFMNLLKRAQKCLDADGGHFQHLL